MSTAAPVAYVQQWKDQTTHTFQSDGYTMKHTTTQPVKVVGDKMHFFVAEPIEAEEDVKRGDKSVPAEGALDRISMESTKSKVFTRCYEDDLDQMTLDERQVESTRSGKALGRSCDKKIVKAIKQTPKIISAYANAPHLKYLLQGKAWMSMSDVPVSDGELFYATDSVSFSMFLDFDQFANSNWAGPDLPYVNGNMAKTWNGIHIFVPSDKTLGANPDNNQVESLLYHKSAVGAGTTRDITGNVVWNNDYDSWDHNMRMRNGSKLLLPNGACRIRSAYDETLIDLTKRQ